MDNKTDRLAVAALFFGDPGHARSPADAAAREPGGGRAARGRGSLAAHALRMVCPATVRQFFALANRRLRWQLNDLARRLDERPAAAALAEPGAAAPPGDAVPLEEDA